jgi:hypothetical protein
MQQINITKIPCDLKYPQEIALAAGELFSRGRPAGYNETLTAIATPGCCRLNM